MKANKQWNDRIVKALREKGFSKKAARKTAKMTMRKSVASHERAASGIDPSKFTTKTVVIDGVERVVKVYPPSQSARAHH